MSRAVVTTAERARSCLWGRWRCLPGGGQEALLVLASHRDVVAKHDGLWPISVMSSLRLTHSPMRALAPTVLTTTVWWVTVLS
jgi:hypothetical protein